MDVWALLSDVDVVSDPTVDVDWLELKLVVVLSCSWVSLSVCVDCWLVDVSGSVMLDDERISDVNVDDDESSWWLVVVVLVACCWVVELARSLDVINVDDDCWASVVEVRGEDTKLEETIELLLAIVESPSVCELVIVLKVLVRVWIALNWLVLDALESVVVSIVARKISN